MTPDMIPGDVIVSDIVIDKRPLAPDPKNMTRGEFEQWTRDRGRGCYDVYKDRMLFRTSRAVYRVEMPVRFETTFHDGIVYALVSDIERYGKLM